MEFRLEGFEGNILRAYVPRNMLAAVLMLGAEDGFVSVEQIGDNAEDEAIVSFAFDTEYLDEVGGLNEERVQTALENLPVRAFVGEANMDLLVRHCLALQFAEIEYDFQEQMVANDNREAGIYIYINMESLVGVSMFAEILNTQGIRNGIAMGEDGQQVLYAFFPALAI